VPISRSQLAKARQLFAQHQEVLRTSDAIRMGIHPRTLYALRDSGEVEQVSRGFYRLAAKPALTDPDLVAVALRIPRAVICLISALAYHRLTNEIPHTVDVAIPSHSQIPKLGGIPLRAFWYSEPSFSAGVQTVSIDGIAARIYSPEKSIADCFKYRNKIGLDVAIQALRTYREQARKSDLNRILKFAAVNRVEKVMRPYLEAVL
jgi:predicted transcriptional regulator of viral defense system